MPYADFRAFFALPPLLLASVLLPVGHADAQAPAAVPPTAAAVTAALLAARNALGTLSLSSETLRLLTTSYLAQPPRHDTVTVTLPAPPAVIVHDTTVVQLPPLPPLPAVHDTTVVQLPAPPAVIVTITDTLWLPKPTVPPVVVPPVIVPPEKPPVVVPPVVVPPVSVPPATVPPPVVAPRPAGPAPAPLSTELPRFAVDVSLPAVTRRVPVHAGANLQLAINAAVRGDALVLDSGATWVGEFTLPPKPGTYADGWITITTSATLPVGVRVTAADSASLAHVLSDGHNVPALRTVGAVSGYRLIGLDLGVVAGPASMTAIVLLGSGQATSAAAQSDHLILDRSRISASATLSVQRCLDLESAWSAVVESELRHCAMKGADSQAILSYNSPGPLLIEDNYLEGAGENLMFGGADPATPGLTPSDITVRRNYIVKPLAWLGVYTVKNLVDTKNARRVLFEANIWDGSWVDGQVGFAIVLKSTNQSNTCPTCQSRDITFRLNVVRNAAGGISIAAHPEIHPAVLASHFSVTDNLFTQIGLYGGTSMGRMVMLLGGLDNVDVSHNTFVHDTSFARSGVSGPLLMMDQVATQPLATNIRMSDNVGTYGGPYGAVLFSGTAQGTASLVGFSPTMLFDRNVIVGLPLNFQRFYPIGQTYPASLAAVGFSPLWELPVGVAATNGAGANIAALRAALVGVAPAGVTTIQ